MKTRRKTPPHVKVTWIDAAGPETLEQYNLETAKSLDLELAEDSGWILTVDDIRIVLGSEKFADGEYRRQSGRGIKDSEISLEVADENDSGSKEEGAGKRCRGKTKEEKGG
jgi:hypothetical protein